MQKKIKEKSLKQPKLLFKKPAVYANVSPQKDSKSFTLSIQHKIPFLARTTANIKDMLEACAKSIKNELLPNQLRNPAHSENTGISFRCQ